jgi:two-component system heavy metal sensor histidine kinase CusS
MTAQVPAPTTGELSRAARDAYIHQVTSSSGKPFLVLLAHISGGDRTDPAQFVEVALDRSQGTELLAEYRRQLWLVLCASLVLCSGIGYAIARSGMQPIKRIELTAARIRSMTLHERIDLAGLPTELAGLASTFNHMLDRLEASFQQVSHFSDNVAHELRTPINNLRGELEVALSKQRSGEDYRGILASGLEECDKITRLVQSLLFLARTEDNPDALQRESVDVSNELAAMEDFFGATAAEAGIELRISHPPRLTVEVHRTLFQQALGNLVSNALAHTPRGGRVTISASSSNDNDGVIISVADTGKGIAAEHLPHIFERFYRVDLIQSGKGGNTGLGLAVVKRIITLHGGAVDVASELGHGTQFRLVLPTYR